MEKETIRRSVLAAAVGLMALLALAGCGSEDTVSGLSLSGETEPVDAIDAVLDTRTIPNGIYIGDVSVGGMTTDSASVAIRDYVESIADQPVILAAEDETLETTVTELGFTEDVETTLDGAVNYGQTGNLLTRYKQQKDLEREDKVLPLILIAEEDTVREYLDDHVWELNKAAVDYGLTRENGEFVIIEGTTGIYVDVDESVRLIRTAFAGGWQENTTIQLAAEVTQPRGSEEELALVQDCLGRFATDYSSSGSARKQNIAVAASYIDDTVIYPGDTFSVAYAVTPFNEERGYAEAPSYENGTTVDTYGGGVCQVSTTLYNAVIRAELEVNERHAHSMIVSYVDPSADAAISAGSLDFKFTNNTDAPIYISGYGDGATVAFAIYGHETRPANRTVSFESETLDTVETEVEYKASYDASFGTITQVQSSHVGKTAQLWKIVTVDGVVESRTVFNSSYYKMSPAIYEVGVKSSNSEATSALVSAIATNDRDRINAVISSYNNPQPAQETEPDTTSEPAETSDTGGGSDTGDSGGGDGTG